MSLLNKSMTKCVFLDKTKTPDGEGGYINIWTEGAQFEAAITFDTSIEARMAEKQGVKSLYTVTTNTGVPLEYHDVFRSNEDDKIFRVTSDGDDKRTPKVASFQFLQVTAEEFIPV